VATTVSKLEVELTLDASDFQMKVSGTTAALAKFRGALAVADKQTRKHEKSVHSLSTSFRHTVVTLGLLQNALRTAWRYSGGLVKGVVDVNAEFERLNVLLRGMSKGTTEIEKATDAARQFNQVIEMAKSAPFTVKELTNSWVKFRSVGIDPAAGSLQALTDAVASFGGTDDILHRATIAVQQMAGKGVISMEELRQQMGEAVPQAMILLARGMNLSVQDMVTAISKGQVVAKPALEKMFAEFDLTFGGRAIDLMDTYIGSMNRLSTVWQLTLKEMGDASGLFEAVKKEVKELIVQLDNPVIRRGMIDIAVGMVKGFTALVAALKSSAEWLYINGQLVMQLVGAWAAFKATRIVVYLIATNTILAAIGKTLSAFIGLQWARLFAGGAAIRTNSKLLQVAWTALKGIFKLPILGWVGILLSIVAATWGWFKASDAVNESVVTGIDHIRKYGEASEEAEIAVARAQTVAMQTRIQQQKDYIVVLQQSRKIAEENGLLDAAATLTAAIPENAAQLAILENYLKEATDLIEDATTKAARRIADAARQASLSLFHNAMSEARNAARDVDVQLDTLFTENLINEKQRLAARLVNWTAFKDAQTEYHKTAVAEQNKIIETADQIARGEQTQDVKDEWALKKEIAVEFIKEITRTWESENIRLENDLAHIIAENNLLNGATDSVAEANSALLRIFQNSSGKLAGMEAELLDGMKEAAKFAELIKTGKFGDQSTWLPEMWILFNKIVPLLEKIDATADEIARKNSFEAAVKTAETALARATEEAVIFGEAVAAGLDDVPNNRVRQFRRMIAGLVEQFGEASEEGKALLAIQDLLLKRAEDINSLERTLQVRKELKDLSIAAIVNARERFEVEQKLFDQQWGIFLLENAHAANIAQLTELYEELRRKRAEAFEDSTPMRRMLREWEDVTGAMEEIQARWVDSFVDTLVDGLAEGRIEFAAFAKAILADLLKIIIRGLIAKAIMSALTGGPTAEVESIDLGGFDIGGAINSAMGNVVGPNGSQYLKRYARGGIATTPQISIFGEGDQNEAYVPLPDGRSIPVSLNGGNRSTPNVTVNVINESGTPVEAEQQGAIGFDGKQYVLDVVLTAANTPGAFRSGLQQATRS